MIQRRRLLTGALAAVGAATLPATGARAADVSDAASGPPPGTTLPARHQGPGLTWVDLKDREGVVIRLNNAPYADRIRVVNFWATWCGPCLLEMPSLDRLRQSLAGKPVEVVAVSVGDSVNQVEQFLSKLPVGLPVLLDSTKAMTRAWQINVLPETFIFDRAGKLQYRVPGPREWDSPSIRQAIERLTEG